jgi:glycosyltransferase involved in cell wall biosynthesis
LLFVGGDFERKGGPLLLEAMRGGLAESCELHIVTRDPLPTQRNVYVHNGLGPNSAELLNLFEMADVFVLPSLGECLAVVLMEATAAGLPVITTDIAALGEAVRVGESGLLIPPGDGPSLRAAIAALASDAALRRRMGRGGLALAREKFDAHRNNEALLDLTQEIARTAHSDRRVA